MRDPEGDRLELYYELPWCVSQPMRLAVDLGASDAEITATAERHARSLPGFLSRDAWRRAMADRTGVR